MKTDVLVSVAIISSLLTCGLLIPIWILVAVIIFTIKIFTRPKSIRTQNPTSNIRRHPIMTYVPPDNSFASDWEYRYYDINGRELP